MKVATGVALLLAALLAAGCTSSKPSGNSVPSVPSTPTTPTTSAAPSTPTPTPTHTTPKPKPKPKPAPALSPYEADPAVAASRAWMAEAAKTINSGHYESPALRALMTAGLASTMHHVLGGDVGLHYPGPIPFTPLSVHPVNAHTRLVRVCLVGTGFAEKPKTHRPAAPLTVIPTNVEALKQSNRWIISEINEATDFSCKGVHVKMPRW